MFKFLFAIVALVFVASCGQGMPQQVSTCRFYGDPDCASRTDDGKFVCSDRREVAILAECWCDPTQGVHWDGRVCVANPVVPTTCGPDTVLVDLVTQKFCVPAGMPVPQTECAPGTHLGIGEDMYKCLPDATCGPNMTLVNGVCHGPDQVICGPGTHLMDNKCVPDPVAPPCAPGTYAWNGMCYVDPTFGGSCSGSVLRVPRDCTTIQQAANTARFSGSNWVSAPLTTILVAPGTYNESVRVPSRTNIIISRDEDGEVIVNGGDKSAFTTQGGEGVWLTLQNITVQSGVPQNGYDPTVFAGYGGMLYLDNVVVRTTNVGVETAYTHGTRIENSRIVGDGSAQSVGVKLDFQNTPGDYGAGDHVRNNRFENLGTGIFRCSGGGLNTDRGLDGTDTNTYQGVSTPYLALAFPCQR